ncbi:MAG: hypothetical protein V4669_15410 [Pseudomonadota bacterium]
MRDAVGTAKAATANETPGVDPTTFRDEAPSMQQLYLAQSRVSVAIAQVPELPGLPDAQLPEEPQVPEDPQVTIRERSAAVVGRPAPD